MKNYRELPKLRDSISYLYTEHSVIEQDNHSLVIIRRDERIAIPVASTTCLMLGPGTSITHAAIKTAADNGCMIVWCGEQMLRFYASGTGETRNAKNLLHQAKLCMNHEAHLEVVKRMYERRFPKLPPRDYTIQQLRGMEGIRMKEAYKMASKKTGIPWNGRNYKTSEWEQNDPLNKALSQANAMLYSVCQAAIISLGFSTGLGFVHTGKLLSFVYDVADLYKAETTIPAAFEAVKQGEAEIDRNIRKLCRNYFSSSNLMKRIPEDIAWVLNVSCDEHSADKTVGDIWDPDENIAGGYNHAKEAEGEI